MRGWWKDTGQVQDMLEANRLILDDLGERVDGELVDSRVEGRVVIEEGARLERATVRGPGDDRGGHHLVDAYIGPYTAIGEDVQIERRRDRALDRAVGLAVRDLEGRIEASLIGRNVAIARSPALPKAYRFVVGDNADVRSCEAGWSDEAWSRRGGMLGQDVMRAAGAGRGRPDARGARHDRRAAPSTRRPSGPDDV